MVGYITSLFVSLNSGTPCSGCLVLIFTLKPFSPLMISLDDVLAIQHYCSFIRSQNNYSVSFVQFILLLEKMENACLN